MSLSAIPSAIKPCLRARLGLLARLSRLLVIGLFSASLSLAFGSYKILLGFPAGYDTSADVIVPIIVPHWYLRILLNGLFDTLSGH